MLARTMMACHYSSYLVNAGVVGEEGPHNRQAVGRHSEVQRGEA